MRYAKECNGVVELAYPFIMIAEQGKWQAVFLAEQLVGIDGIGTDPEDGNTALGEFGIVVAVAAELRGANRRIVCGIEHKQYTFANEGRKRNFVAF